jgi:hypothetical protein
MSWGAMLFFMTLAESIAAYFIYLIYSKTFFPDVTPAYMVRMLLFALPINLLLIFLWDKLSGFANGFFFNRGAGGKNLYSHERSMAMHGQREEACQRLARAASKGDPRALKLLAEIATDQPVMHTWMSKVTVLRGKARGMTREDHAGLDAMLSRVHRPR